MVDLDRMALANYLKKGKLGTYKGIHLWHQVSFITVPLGKDTLVMKSVPKELLSFVPGGGRRRILWCSMFKKQSNTQISLLAKAFTEKKMQDTYFSSQNFSVLTKNNIKS